jgi:hypothetical protein
LLSLGCSIISEMPELLCLHLSVYFSFSIQIGSRRVVQYSAVFMIVFGIFTKCGALFITIPDPVIGGTFFILFSKYIMCFLI